MAFISSTCEPLRIWSRLGPRARQVDFAGTLSAPIADPMFLLGRQWQFGEFAGTDAGSAIFATLAREIHPMTVPRAGRTTALTPSPSGCRSRSRSSSAPGSAGPF